MKAKKRQQQRALARAEKNKVICNAELPAETCPTPHKCGKTKFHYGLHGNCQVGNGCSKEWPYE